jgi:hypothetical protein
MTYIADIRSMLKGLNDKSVTMQMSTAEVVSVDKNEDSCECDPINGDANFVGVRLKASLDGVAEGFVIYPKVGTVVIIALINGDEATAYVAQVSEIDEVKVKFGSTLFHLKDDNTIEIDAPKIVMRKGTRLGIPSVVPLVARLNAIESTLNALIAQYMMHYHIAPGPGMTPFVGPPVGPVPSVVPFVAPITTVPGIENPNITQG